ncbi:glutathione peroxidase [Methylorubrum populi BJ001]|jgi:glutathione peroxidase|uniref:Glutathione peroxidase n=1 Tax=Methylorubrum populi (strain ATCC BAA-705 / NCIMB 13946 / BJ001) TaxID=441620 RepID=B1ZI84_METPB|nr:glutathione peroxidase [Methylorubrum populi]ACB78570.1 glutathione peroxidase [Methylorubrum populi BJ001]OAH35075.1 glutathione peroxidase [Methylorubrum populi]PZP69869.1 MAG: glutathione peroxidase [Methylorubrum populi]
MTIRRRDCLAMLAVLAAGRANAPAYAAESGPAGAFAFDTPGGGTLPLSAYAGKPVLVVNTATACGYAPQFAGLQGLWTRFGDRGLTVIAVPSPDFGNQEPLDGAAIAEAARKNHGVTFPVADKTHVRGPAAHPFYRWAAEQKPGQSPQWNFHKYLVGRDGTLRAAFATQIDPSDPRIVSAIVAELGQA